MNTRFEEAFNLFVNEMKQDISVHGILFFGSAQRNEEKKTSDLDFYIIVDGDEGWNYKKFYNGVPVEAYFYPLQQWLKGIKENHHIMNAFATGTNCIHQKQHS